MSKNILEESTIRKFMKLANIGTLSDNFMSAQLSEDTTDDLETLAEDFEASTDVTGTDDTFDPNAPPPTTALGEADVEAAEEEDVAAAEDYEEEAAAEDYEEEEDVVELTIEPRHARAIVELADMFKEKMPELSAEPEGEFELEPEGEAPVAVEEPEGEAAVAVEEPEGEVAVAATEEEDELLEGLVSKVALRVVKRLAAKK